MRKIFLIPLAALVMANNGGCDDPTPTAKDKQADRGAQIAERMVFTQNAEQDNIARRLKLTTNPGQIGFILLMNQAGQPIAYYGVRGKITSSGKQLTAPVKDWGTGGNNIPMGTLEAAPSDEGTWGSSDPYVYFWTADGQYIQWNGAYLYSDKPFRTRVAPLVIAIGERA